MELVWDKLDERIVDQGVDHGILFERVGGAYVNGVAWNGLVSVTSSPSGAEPNKQYADNIVYVNILSVEEYSATIEAFMAPREFDKYNGVGQMAGGLKIGQQNRGVFGFYWRSIRGTAENPEQGFVHHFAWGCQASVAEKANTTKSETPEIPTQSFSLSTTPEAVPGFNPTAYAEIDELDPDYNPANIAAILEVVYGNEVNDPRLPLPGELDTMLGAGVLTDTPAQPAFDGVDEITIPADPGTDYYVDGELVPDGALTITEDTIVEARPAPGYTFTGVFVDKWLYEVP